LTREIIRGAAQGLADDSTPKAIPNKMDDDNNASSEWHLSLD
jgi:hypothetical protein